MLTRVTSTVHTSPPQATALREYLGRLPRGAHAALARDLGIDRVYLSQLVASDRKPSPELCARLERQTSGELTCEALRPDLDWHRVPDQDWPYHLSGRPVIEVVPVTTPGALDEKAVAP